MSTSPANDCVSKALKVLFELNGNRSGLNFEFLNSRGRHVDALLVYLDE